MEDLLKVWLKRLKLNESTISMILGLLVVVVVGTLLYNFFTSSEDLEGELGEGITTEEYSLELEEETDGTFVPQGLPVSHTVSQGESLWKISEIYYGNGYNWVDLSQENQIINPEIIEEGQILTIPKVALRVPPQPETITETVQVSPGTISETAYTVVKGDTLWSIAVRAYQDGYKWPEVYQTNRNIISQPDLIEIGMELSLPR